MMGPNLERHFGVLEKDGVDCYVCLQIETSPNQYKQYIKNPRAVFKHYKIVDTKTPSHKELLSSIREILELIAAGRVVYIHCAGGHGRTGLYVCCIVACMYPELQDVTQILHFVQSAHDMRKTQTKHFHGILPGMVAENPCQRKMLAEFVGFLQFT